jgi:7,8-dihydropterin-6-yl-methyl-4-(beta-D-ribofuranosyl)aminobenzene 5'-phosphate synthase
MPQVILFDTGSDGNILLTNIKKMGIDPKKVNAVFLSHFHSDHTGGLSAFLQQNPRVTVYLPASFPASFQKSIIALGSECRTLNKPLKLINNVYTSGEMGSWIKEQSLVINTPKGLVIITGCAHPGIVEIVSQTKNWLQKEVYLVMGGFHLEGQPLGELQLVAEKLKNLGVKKVAPSHCTGDVARKLFRKLWGQNFLESGVGARIEVLP